MWTNVNNAKFSLFSYGGLITRGPLQGTQFGANGATSQFNYGFGYNGLPATPARGTGNTINNCTTGGYCVGGDLSGNQTGYASLVGRLVRGNTYARVSYDLTPEIEIYATGIYSEVVSWNKPTQDFFKSDNLQIGCDNAFLPSAIATACTAAAGPGGAYAPTAAVAAAGVGAGMAAGSFTYGALNSPLTSVENYNNRTLRRFVVGADGVFSLFDTDWAFKGYVEHGESDFHNVLENMVLNNYYTAAIDAVTVTPGNAAAFAGVPVGSTVCRSASARSVGCQPLNIIGTNGASLAGLSFVQGLNGNGSSSGELGRDPWTIVNQRQEVVDFSVSGSPFSDWAGKVSIATGFTYREEAINATSDCASQGNCANQTFDGVAWGASGDPLLNAGTAGAPPASPNWYAGNFQPSRGAFHEWETFLETNVPLLDSQEWGHVDANLAGRYTHYTTSGDVETWKVGVVWDTPFDGLRLRALQSRDVRAPNLSELFAGAKVNNGSVVDDFNLNGGAANQTISPLPNPITANPALKPEKGQTTELGVVWSPTEVPGLNLSATYYRLAVGGIITQLTQQQEMDLCFSGVAAQCAFISTNGQPWATGGVINTALTLTRPTSQITPQINIASIVTEGVDYEASYQFALDDAIPWSLGGDMTLRMLATNVGKYVTNPGIPTAATVESAGTNTSVSSTPHWKVFFNQGYETDRWGFFLNERWFSEGVVNRNWVACASACPAPVDINHPTVNSNYLPGELYFDVGGHYDISPITSLWFKVDNLTNQNPGNAYNYAPATQSPPLTPQLYDVLGRFYHIGIRITN
jgi:outer membrane receptor protein involved in Fe transport